MAMNSKLKKNSKPTFIQMRSQHEMHQLKYKVLNFRKLDKRERKWKENFCTKDKTARRDFNALSRVDCTTNYTRNVLQSCISPSVTFWGFKNLSLFYNLTYLCLSVSPLPNSKAISFIVCLRLSFPFLTQKRSTPSLLCISSLFPSLVYDQ